MENILNDEKHAYWEGVVERITNKDPKKQIFGIKFKVGSGRSLCGNEYEMMRGQGFTKANMPQVGDSVLLRYNKGNGYRCCKEFSKIVKVLKRCGE